MPLYDYQCQQCHRHTEKIQKFSDAPLTECPHCGGHLERVVHAPALAFKGGGWYADGYGNVKPKAAGEGKTADGKSDSGSTKPSEKSGESSSKDSSAPSGSSTASSAPATPAASSSGTK